MTIGSQVKITAGDTHFGKTGTVVQSCAGAVWVRFIRKSKFAAAGFTANVFSFPASYVTSV